MIAGLVVALLSANAQAPSQAFEARLVIGSGVVCRAQPDRASAAVRTYRLGEQLTVRGISQDRSGAAWHEVVDRRTCWVSGPLTVAFAGYDAPDAALAAIAEHALALGADASFEHLVAVDNLLIERKLRRTRYFRAPAAVPPLLELRQLQVVDRAARKIDRTQAERDPLTNAWLLAHADVVTHFEPGALYHVRGSQFWALHDRIGASPFSEEIAWTAAESPVFTDECYTECHLSVLSQSYMPYWRQFHAGVSCAKPLRTGPRRARTCGAFLSARCGRVPPGKPGPDPDSARPPPREPPGGDGTPGRTTCSATSPRSKRCAWAARWI